MYLLVDNYDSFTFNLAALIKRCGGERIDVVKNNQPIVDPLKYRGIFLSPGPSSPKESGATVEYIRRSQGRVPILGVCLGMQAIGEFLGGDIKRANSIRHGKVEVVDPKRESTLFEGIGESFSSVRYHSLAVDIDSKYVTSYARSDNEVMSIEDSEKMLFGVQFHPESYKSLKGEEIVKNFIKYCNNVGSSKDRKDIKKIIQSVVEDRRDLSYKESQSLFESITAGELTDSQISALLVGLRMKGEKPEEILGALTVLDRKKVGFDKQGRTAIDTCGTGGDKKSTFNISTAVSILLSSLGLNVIKHGNRAQSGTIGSADIIERMGIKLSTADDQVTQNNSYNFLFAPSFHPALKVVKNIRREIGVPTIFNLLGPLLNPAEPEYQIIGVGDKRYLSTLVDLFKLNMRGREGIILYHSEDGYDEVSTNGITHCTEIDKYGDSREFTIDPSHFFHRQPMPSIKNSEEGEILFLRGLSGSDPHLTNVIAINSALALRCCSLYPDLEEGFKIAKEEIQSGRVKEKLRSLREGKIC